MKDFTLSYKKGSNSPLKLDEEKQKWLKHLLWLNLIQNLKFVKVLINFDG